MQATDHMTDPRTLVRTHAPDTSKAAANAVNSTKLETLVLGIIRDFGDTGCISDEVRAVAAERGVTSYSSVTARYRSLEERGLIQYTGAKRRGNSSRSQRVMRVIQ